MCVNWRVSWDQLVPTGGRRNARNALHTYTCIYTHTIQCVCIHKHIHIHIVLYVELNAGSGAVCIWYVQCSVFNLQLAFWGNTVCILY